MLGRHRAAWVVSPSLHAVQAAGILDQLQRLTSEAAPPYATPEDLTQGSAFAQYRVTLSLLNADPAAWVGDWDGPAVAGLLRPFLSRMATAEGRPQVDVHCDTQIIHHGQLPETPVYDATAGAHVLSAKAMKRLLLVNDWKLNAISTPRQSTALNFLLFVPPARYCPLVLRSGRKNIAPTAAFSWPGWGGVALFCPPNASLRASEDASGLPPRYFLRAEDVEAPMALFTTQLRQLIGATWSLTLPQGWRCHSDPSVPSSWEADLWRRQLAVRMASQAAHTLHGLHRLLSRLPSIPLTDRIAQQIDSATAAVRTLAGSPFTPGALRLAQRALRQSEDAFFHPSLFGQMYFPDEHRLAVFSPFFLPVLFSLALGVAHFKRQWTSPGGSPPGPKADRSD
eukprot:GGOE01037404.1.p1 GENE.GGOE01037404.1~~GGOE01037404.1.p1  ORF type:complete len:396 (+),score=88.93 GGOE01037404.1:3-1190(+)